MVQVKQSSEAPAAGARLRRFLGVGPSGALTGIVGNVSADAAISHVVHGREVRLFSHRRHRSTDVDKTYAQISGQYESIL